MASPYDGCLSWLVDEEGIPVEVVAAHHVEVEVEEDGVSGRCSQCPATAVVLFTFT